MAFKKILVAIDGSETSEKALELVAGLSSSLGTEVVLLAVTDSRAHFDEGEAESSDDDAENAAKYLEHKAAPLREMGLSVSPKVESGSAADTILSVAKDIGADVIAMATHRGSAIARGILGSVTDRVMRASELPVLAVYPESGQSSAKQSWTPSTVIVPLDGSELAEQSVSAAIEIAESCGAELIFVRAVRLPSYAVSGPGAEFYGQDYGVSSNREGAEEYLSQFVEMAKSKGISASAHAALGNPAARLIEESNNVPDAMIVITSHGRGGMRRMVLGSVADKIVRASHHPVLVLKHGDGG